MQYLSYVFLKSFPQTTYVLTTFQRAQTVVFINTEITSTMNTQN